METSRANEGKRSLKEVVVAMDEEEEEEDDDDDLEDERKRRSSGGNNKKSTTPPSCQVDNCTVDMSEAKRYHRRHKVCEHHAKASAVLLAGIHQRFCQQCSRFHEVSEFDDAKRSCRRRLAGHNERRRKNSTDPYQGDPSN